MCNVMDPEVKQPIRIQRPKEGVHQVKITVVKEMKAKYPDADMSNVKNIPDLQGDVKSKELIP